MKQSLVIFGAFLCTAFFAATASAQDDIEPKAPAAAPPALYAMKLTNDVLSGPGADLILARLPDAQFVLVGEEHGFADSPRLALALAHAGRRYGLTHHVIETGPLSEEWASEILRKDGVDGLAHALAGRPLAFPFLVMREDAELAQYFVRTAPRRADPLWGVDQEFVGSPQLHFDTLARLAPDGQAKALAESLLETERVALAAGNQGGLFLFRAQAEDFAKLRTAFGTSRAAAKIIDALEESSGIYRSYAQGKGYASNADRIALVRRQFLDAYGNAPGPAPRALLKMGSIHLGKGTTFLNTFDLGSLTEGIAAENGLPVLRILYFPVAGKVTRVMPSVDSVFVTEDYRDDEFLASLAAIGVKEDMIATDGFTIIPLEPVRRTLGQEGLNGLAEEFRFFLLGYDFLVTTRNALPATPMVK